METNLNQKPGDQYQVPISEERESWKNLVQRLYDDLATLFQKEGQLVRTEMNEKFDQVKTASSSLLLGGLVLFVGIQCLAATAIILISQVTAVWIAATVVTAFLLVVGALVFSSAKKKLNAEDLRPRKSIEAFEHIRFSLKEKVNEITKH
jgi:hypothetical protein